MQHGRLGWPAVWGIAGVIAVLVQAIVKLLPLALELLHRSLTVVQLLALLGWVAISAYAEGYRGFHRQFSPRVVARAAHLSHNPQLLHVVLAPVYCMGLIHSTRKRLVVSWILTLTIVVVVVFVRRLPQPWRGIVDAGVVIGLSLGMASIAYHVVRALRGHVMPVPPDVPFSHTQRS